MNQHKNKGENHGSGVEENESALGFREKRGVLTWYSKTQSNKESVSWKNEKMKRELIKKIIQTSKIRGPNC